MNSHHQFWLKHPALLYGATLLIATGGALFWDRPWQILFPLLWAFYLILLKKWPAILLIPSMMVYCYILYGNIPESQEIQGIFSISSLEPHSSPFQKGHVYRGTLDLPGASIPCSIYSRDIHRPPADRDYQVAGTLVRRSQFDYTLKPHVWVPVEGSWSLAQFRFLAKEKYRHFLESRLQNSRVANLLASLTTGDVEDRLLKYEFGRLGLQHILAISGFHFGILIAFCSFALSFLPRFWKLFLLLAAINAYYLFAGAHPGIQRSWLTASIYLLGRMGGRCTNGLNLLGLTLGFEVISNPLVAGHIGFQLSFASCGGILLLHPAIEKSLHSILPKRSLADLSKLSWPSKHAYLLSAFLRQAISLTIAVNIFILPILLFHFHVFPLLSLFYNLFYPFCIGLVLFLLLSVLIIHAAIPWFSPLAFTCLEWISARLLDLAAYPPAFLDIPLIASWLPYWGIPPILFALFSLHLTKKFLRS